MRRANIRGDMAAMVRAPSLALLFILPCSAAACYSPSFANCQIDCVNDDSCPTTMSCRGGLCAHAGESCNGRDLSAGGPPDASLPRDALGDAAGGNDAAPDAGPDCAAASNPSDLWVDIAAPAGGVGAKGCPFQRLTEAIAAATASSATGVTVHVAAGHYGAQESFPLFLRKGISLDGAGSTKTIIEGTSMLDRSNVGGQLANSYQVTLVVGDAAAARTSTISNLTVRSSLSTPAAGYLGILCDQGNAPDDNQPLPTPFPTPNVIIREAVIGGGYDTGVVATTTTRPKPLSGCNLQILHSQVIGNWRSVWSVGCGVGDGAITVALHVGDGSDGGANTFTNMRNPNWLLASVEAFDCTSPISVLNNKFIGGISGLSFADWAPAGGAHTYRFADIEGNTFNGSQFRGLFLGMNAVADKVLDNTFTGISWHGGGQITAAAIELRAEDTSSASPQIRMARGNQILANDVGILFAGPGALGAMSDFGTSADRGMNTIACNSTVNHSPAGGDLVFEEDLPPGAAPIPFQGNSWDHSPPHAATASAAMDGQDVTYASTSVAAPILTGSDGPVAACMSPFVPGP
jgi:hypothetical protein